MEVIDTLYKGEVECKNYGSVVRDKVKGCCGVMKRFYVISCLEGMRELQADIYCRRQLCRNYVKKELVDESGPVISG
jgi:hypothetical protein